MDSAMRERIIQVAGEEALGAIVRLGVEVEKGEVAVAILEGKNNMEGATLILAMSGEGAALFVGEPLLKIGEFPVGVVCSTSST